MCLAAIIFIKRIYLALPFYNNHFEAIFSSFAFVLISGATLLFNSEFLEVKIINPFTKGFFFFELLLCTLLSLLSFWIKQYHLFAQIMYTFVFIYALIVFLMVIFQEVRHFNKFSFHTKLKFGVYFFITINILIISGSYALYKHPSLPPLALLLSIVFYLEIELMIHALSKKESNPINYNDKQIIQLLCDGCIYKEISYQMGIPLNTLKKRITEIYRVHNVSTRNELINLNNTPNEEEIITAENLN